MSAAVVGERGGGRCRDKVGAVMHMGARGSGDVEHDGKGSAVSLLVRMRTMLGRLHAGRVDGCAGEFGHSGWASGHCRRAG
jgi:hypothetical protein